MAFTDTSYRRRITAVISVEDRDAIRVVAATSQCGRTAFYGIIQIDILHTRSYPDSAIRHDPSAATAFDSGLVFLVFVFDDLDVPAGRSGDRCARLVARGLELETVDKRNRPPIELSVHALQ